MLRQIFASVVALVVFGGCSQQKPESQSHEVKPPVKRPIIRPAKMKTDVAQTPATLPALSDEPRNLRAEVQEWESALETATVAERYQLFSSMEGRILKYREVIDVCDLPYVDIVAAERYGDTIAPAETAREREQDLAAEEVKRFKGRQVLEDLRQGRDYLISAYNSAMRRLDYPFTSADRLPPDQRKVLKDRFEFR